MISNLTLQGKRKKKKETRQLLNPVQTKKEKGGNLIVPMIISATERKAVSQKGLHIDIDNFRAEFVL